MKTAADDALVDSSQEVAPGDTYDLSDCRIGHSCAAHAVPAMRRSRSLITWLRQVTAKEIHKGSLFQAAILVMQTTIAVILLHGIVILLWAGFFRWLCFRSWESAVYFSGCTYATVGYGDVLLPQQWRLLGPLESMVGVLMCGISVGLLFALITRLIGSDSGPKLTTSRTSGQ